MKTVRIASLLLCLILLLSAMVSCGMFRPDVDDLYKGEYQVQWNDLDCISQPSVSLAARTNNGRGFVVLDDSSTISVYDLLTDKIVYTSPYTGKAVFDAGRLGERRYFMIRFTSFEDVSTKMFNEDGTLITIANLENSMNFGQEVRGGLLFNGYLFYDDGTAIAAKEITGNMQNILQKEIKPQNGYHYLDEANGITVYDEEYRFYDIISFENADQKDTFFMKNGNILIQYVYNLPATEEVYDYYDTTSNTKCNLKTMLWEAKGKSLKEIKLNYVIQSLSALDDSDYEEENGIQPAKKIRNSGVITPIENKRLQNPRLAIIEDDGSLKFTTNELFNGCYNSVPVPIGPDLYFILTITNHQFISDEKGNILGEVNSTPQFTGTHIITSDRIYDTEMKEVFNLEKEGYSLVNVIGQHSFFSKDGKYYRFVNGAMSLIEEIKAGDRFNLANGFYTITHEKGNVDLYTLSGTLTRTFSNPILLIESYKNKALYCYTENGETCYFVINTIEKTIPAK